MRQEAQKRGLDPAIYFLLLGFIPPAIPIAIWMNERFFEQDSYYSHGWLVLPAIILLIWERSGRKTPPVPRKISLTGFFLFSLGLIICLAAQKLEVFSPAAWALVLAILGLFISLEGFTRVRRYLPPLALLSVMIPLPGVWLLALTARLKILSARTGVFLARGLGINAHLEGVEIFIPGSPRGPNLTIGAPCSGLRSILVFGAIGLFMFLVSRKKLSRRIIYLITALLLAPVANLLRVVILIMVRRLAGPWVVQGLPHIIIGLGTYGFCLLIYVLVVRLLDE